MGLIAKAPAPSKKVLNNFPDSNIVAIIDADYCSFSCASVGDEDYIEVTHKETKKSVEFKNVTEFYGRSKKTLGGWLGKINTKRESQNKPPYSVEDFAIAKKKRRKQEYRISTDEEGNEIKTPVDMEQAKANIFHSAKTVILNDLKNLGTDNYEAYLSNGSSLRNNIATLMKYKGNRDNTPKPLLFDDVVDYIGNAFEAKFVDGIEVDDAVVIRAYNDPNAVVVGIDKDHYAQEIKFFNPTRPEEGIIDCNCFGKLWRDRKGKVRGYGRLFLYFQVASGDKADNYKSNCFSDVKYGDAAAYNDLADCKDEKEALEKLVEIYKKLYPEYKVVTGWRGFPIGIDWLYVLDEIFKLAAMVRWENDYRSIHTEFARFGVKYKYD